MNGSLCEGCNGSVRNVSTYEGRGGFVLFEAERESYSKGRRGGAGLVYICQVSYTTMVLRVTSGYLMRFRDMPRMFSYPGTKSRVEVWLVTRVQSSRIILHEWVFV